MNIGLIGMPGTMKSTVGRELASMTGMELMDTDEIFEREEGASISDTFDSKGEAYFRRREKEIAERVCGGNGRIISFGGGTPVAECNRAVISRTCFVVRLTASPERIAERCSGDGSRPLLAGDVLANVRRLEAEREPYYSACSDITVDTTDLSPREAAEIILAEAAKRSGGGYEDINSVK